MVTVLDTTGPSPTTKRTPLLWGQDRDKGHWGLYRPLALCFLSLFAVIATSASPFMHILLAVLSFILALSSFPLHLASDLFRVSDPPKQMHPQTHNTSPEKQPSLRRRRKTHLHPLFQRSINASEIWIGLFKLLGPELSSSLFL